MSRIDLNQVWDDARAMGSANKEALAAIAGMFILLPFVVLLQFLATPEMPGTNATPEEISAWYRSMFEANWHLILGWTLLSAFGVLSILALLLRDERPTVAEAMKGALLVLPSFFIAFFLKNLALDLGFFLFIVPALYLAGRFILIAPVAAAENQLNPITLITRSIALTRGNGWRLFFMLAVLTCTTLIVALVFSMVSGLIGALLLPDDIALLFEGLALGLVVAGYELFLALLAAATYRLAAQAALLSRM